MNCGICENPLPTGAHPKALYCPGACKAEAMRRNSAKWREANRGVANQRTTTWRQGSPQAQSKARSYSKAYAKRNKETIRLRRIERDYGITELEFRALEASQQGVCAICRKFHHPLHVDHNHNNGQVRGLLCQKCNTGLGLLGDDSGTLARAIRYLETRSNGIFARTD